MTKPKVSVVIVSFNNQQIVFDCLKSLHQTPGILVYVVDNMSSPEFVLDLETKFPEVEVMHNEANLGFSKANNQALRKIKTPYVLLLNSDTTVPTETIPAMISYMDNHPEVGMAGCRVELADGSLDKACRRSFITPWVGFTHYSYLDKLFPKSKWLAKYNLTYLPEDQTYEVDSVVGAFMMIRKSAMDEAGLLDEDYFMYGEDIDWCYRFKQKGWKIVYYPKVKILHYKGMSSGIVKHSQRMSRASFDGKSNMLKAFYGSMSIFYHKHLIDKYPPWLTGLVLTTVRLKYWLAVGQLRWEYFRVKE